MICKQCKNEIDKKAVVCIHCGCKVKKPFYKKWWFWALLVVVCIGASSGNNKKETSSPATETAATATTQSSVKQENTISYEPLNLLTMMEELKANAMKAEKNYQNKHIEITAKIQSFDSNGKYITVKPTNAGEWDFETAMCYTKNENQRDFLIEKNVGDIVTIQGKVKSVGEVLGYSIDIDNIK